MIHVVTVMHGEIDVVSVIFAVFSNRRELAVLKQFPSMAVSLQKFAWTSYISFKTRDENRPSDRSRRSVLSQRFASFSSNFRRLSYFASASIVRSRSDSGYRYEAPAAPGLCRRRASKLVYCSNAMQERMDFMLLRESSKPSRFSAQSLKM